MLNWNQTKPYGKQVLMYRHIKGAYVSSNNLHYLVNICSTDIMYIVMYDLFYVDNGSSPL